MENALEKLLLSIDRPGDFCAHGRLFAPMPRLDVEGAGALSFPVPEAQVRALIAGAERAPYGKGPETLVDTSVRACWQIDPERVRLAGAAWRETFAKILDSAAAGLGCPAGRLDAQLHKLLIYEPGGFFSAHRDTEKADGMIATLSISLPTAGAGGELVVGHRDREITIDMTAGEPSELAFAAFYADCTHEVRPITEGHRLSLVFNLCLRAGDTETPRAAPDYTAQVDPIARRLAEWGRAEEGADKLVWLLDHEYSAAGLSFGALKNTDAALARILALAAGRADYALYAAIVHIEEYGTAEFAGSVDTIWGGEEPDDNDWEMGDVDDSSQWLDGWVDPAGGRPPFGQVGILPAELLPRGALDDVPPDEERVHEASGNAGVTIERAYRRAAFVLWPRSKTLAIVAGGGIDGAVAWVAEELDRNAGVPDERIGAFMAKLIDIWPSGREARDAPGRARMLRLLRTTGDEDRAVRFLRVVLLSRYDGSENEVLVVVLGMIGPQAARGFLLDLIAAHLRRRPTDTLALLRLLDEARGESAGAAWDDAQRDAVRAAPAGLAGGVAAGAAAGRAAAELSAARAVRRRGHSQPLRARRAPAVDGRGRGGGGRRRRTAADRRAGPDAAGGAGQAVRRGGCGRQRRLRATVAPRGGLPVGAERGGRPRKPRDWAIAASVGCRCEHCERLRAFCKDPVARTARFPLREDLRAHLHQIIDRHRLDIEHVTERRGRPFTLVCTKTRASHQRRLAKYAEDVSCMRGLIRSAPDGQQAARGAADLARLDEAVAAAQGSTTTRPSK